MLELGLALHAQDPPESEAHLTEAARAVRIRVVSWAVLSRAIVRDSAINGPHITMSAPDPILRPLPHDSEITMIFKALRFGHSEELAVHSGPSHL